MTTTIRIPAKINLFLDVLGKRTDGYHDILSIVLPVSLYDTLVLEPLDRDVETVVDRPPEANGVCWEQLMGKPEDNLATRAALGLRKVAGTDRGVRIHLRKNIPIGGGLGGGSADAAAVLVGLNRLWNTGLSQSALMELGGSFGCDIPAFLHGGPVVMEGRGERLTPVPIASGPFWFVLVNPGFGVSTRDIYSRFTGGLTSGRHPSKFHTLLSGLKEGALTAVSEGLFNVLESTVFVKYPLLEMIADGLRKAGALGVLLTGTGSTVFALAKDQRHADLLADRIRDGMESPLWCHVAQSVNCPMV
ncbi:MAG: 4-(cytidine 5'-diphospho)-2-C-methyl-D-erythritol kinase [Lentisphaerae bacterium]|nr:4-(cytidine 5'-diphospho)-2-C-methyl-D-erythritol kinase [Lentisphaerota bacterium]